MIKIPSISAAPPPAFRRRPVRAFSMIELMVVVTLLSLIVLALMSVFSSTQRAFRSAVTQTDVLEGGRATMELVSSDLRAMGISGGASNGPVNFVVTNNRSFSTPLRQSLPGSASFRQNLLQELFVLNHLNNGWWGVGYAVKTNYSGNLYSLYRLQFPTNGVVADPVTLFTNQAFRNFYVNPQNGSHLIDGVVHFVVRAYDTNGTWISTNYRTMAAYTNSLPATRIFPLQGGEAGLLMYSNNIPAAVELELGVLEDRALQHAESLPTRVLQNQYLLDKSGNVHLFRQRVTIPNVDSTAF